MKIIDILVKREEKPEWIIQRWINRGVINPSSYSKSDLISFINNTYNHLSKGGKSSVGLCLKQGVPLDEITPERLKQVKTEHMRSAGKKREEKNKTTKTVDDYKKTIRKGIETRLKKYPDLPPEEAKRKIYIDALLLKAKRYADKNSIDTTNWTESQLLQLTGQQKRETHSNRSEKERIAASVKWKRTNLKHRRVRETLTTHFGSKFPNDIDSMSDEDVVSWYSNYKSIKSVSMIQNRTDAPSKGIQSTHFSSKIPGGRMHCRSDLERRVVSLLDLMPECSEYVSEPFTIMYKRDGEDNNRRYLPDLEMTWNDTKIVVEIKPNSQIENFIHIKGQYLQKLPLIITEQQIRTKEKLYEHIAKYL